MGAKNYFVATTSTELSEIAEKALRLNWTAGAKGRLSIDRVENIHQSLQTGETYHVEKTKTIITIEIDH
jgi:hypothetical protein